ncbi:hypothetical protein G6F16_010827 [Rhizopus arrhizus]|uniref:Uncharacterized protein n=1 Tax=Rhizopus oryzae TaxID=64495 RepID=A0A9P6X297_RHIOR|nr:hypothetical protein G6F23_006541 [Rhizopus arrhizus]KAG0757578.1 hypothetical protein G6F24_010391 [Rhizopus arrhizus]KAG0783721.1 hypothetical protein G6F21_010364 [Rhizopus arrhizus]KAG0799450.1 hypothetical protein G6F22_003214 [Rhizopus arrhizus]KAG0808279.1 hypothetical protein G6F20_009707 [Rhizopus arrhizus]
MSNCRMNRLESSNLEIMSLLDSHQEIYQICTRESCVEYLIVISPFQKTQWVFTICLDELADSVKNLVHGRAATEIFEQLLTIKSEEPSTEEFNQLLDEALESAKRLAIHAWVQSKQHDEDAKDYAIRTLRLPQSLKHLEAKGSGSKREAFGKEFIAKYNEANYQQRVLRAAVTSTSAGRGRGGYQSTSTWNNTRGGCGFYGRGGTKNYFLGRGRGAPTFNKKKKRTF